MSALLEHRFGGLPVVDLDGRVLGVVSDGDLLVREARLHVPTVFTLFRTGDVGFRHPAVEAFLHDLRKTLGSTVGEIMDTAPVTCAESDTIEQAATCSWSAPATWSVSSPGPICSGSSSLPALRPTSPPEPDPWESAICGLAQELLRCNPNGSSVRELQRATLIPLELELLTHRQREPATPAQLTALVGGALGQHPTGM